MVVHMERDSRSCALDGNVAYQLWLAERVKKVMLPFKPTSLSVIREELVTDEEPEEVRQLKKEIEELKGDKIKLSSNLDDLHHSYASLKIDHEGFVKKHEGKRRYILRL